MLQYGPLYVLHYSDTGVAAVKTIVQYSIVILEVKPA